MSSPAVGAAIDNSESASSAVDIVVARCSDAQNASDDDAKKKKIREGGRAVGASAVGSSILSIQKAKKDETLRNQNSGSPEVPSSVAPKTDLKSYWSGGADTEAVPGPPSPNLARQRGVSQRASHPGVVSVAGTTEGDNDATSPPAPAVHSPRPTIQADVRLAVADPVDNDDDLPTAQPTQGVGRQQERTDRLKTRILFGSPILLVVAIVVILVVVFALPNDENKSNKSNIGGGTVAPSSSPDPKPPSAAPSWSPEARVLSLLPDFTLEALGAADDDESSSPQSQAYQWLLRDLELGGEDSVLPDDRLRQRFALATLFYATRGTEKWATREGWLSHELHECDWRTKTSFALEAVLSGLYPGFLQEFTPLRNAPPCNRNGLILHLWLDANKLEGSLPEEIYLLASLQSLSLGLDPIRGTISTRIGLLSNLEGLKISDLKGDQPGPVPSEIGLLTNLRVLGLLNNNHQGTYPKELWQLTNLETLFTGTNPELGGTIPSQISNLGKLRWLSMDGGALTGSIPTEFGLLEELEFVLLLQNQLSGPVPSQVGRLSKAFIFSVYENTMEGTLPTELGLMTSLSWLSFRTNRFSGAIPSQLGLLSNLSVSLNLDNQMFTGTLPTQLGLLASLKKLEFANNRITGSIPSEFSQLASMGKLTMSNNSLSGTFPAELAALQQSLHTVSLDGNPFLSGTIPLELCSLNGTCSGIPMELNPCGAQEGMFFDCTNRLCGCNCSCLDAT